MTQPVSDKLRDALERLDQAIDRLEARVTHLVDAGPSAREEDSATAAVAERLDRVIGRIEAALGG